MRCTPNGAAGLSGNHERRRAQGERGEAGEMSDGKGSAKDEVSMNVESETTG
jgi:hypothetical protein